MKKHLIAGIALVLGSLASIQAQEQWIPGTPLGAKVEFVGLDYSPKVRYETAIGNSRMEVGLVGEDRIFTMYYISSSPGNQAQLYSSLLDARRDGVGVNLLIDSATSTILAVRIGETDQPLAMRGARAGSGWERGDAGRIRFDLLGRKAVFTSKTAAGIRIRERAVPAR